jgi:serine/threonine protein kinase
MTPERWQRIDMMLREVLERPSGERPAFLDQACDGDAAMRDEVDSILSFRERAASFLETPALESARDWFDGDQIGLEPGMLLGQYCIERQIGKGGMGLVYLAYDGQLHRRVAIKLLPPHLEADEFAKKGLIREARAAASLEHPNICAIHEVREDDERNFIVMQYVDGESLADRIKREPLDPLDALDIGIQVAEALAEAHSHGLIHRDIKPHNVMVTPRGHVRVLDFGLAKIAESADSEFAAHIGDELGQTRGPFSAPGVILGTKMYMSPEQANGEPVDARTDLFSLGILLYESITGLQPFAGATESDTQSQPAVLRLDPRPPSKVKSDIPSRLDKLLAKALAKDREARYQSAIEMLTDLRAVRAALRLNLFTSVWEVIKAVAVAFRRSPIVGSAFVGAVTLIGLALFLPRIPHQPTPRAIEKYNLGTRYLRNAAYLEATKELQEALEADDEFVLAHARLAEAWSELDYGDLATGEALRAMSLITDHSGLSRLDSLYLQAVTQVVLRRMAPAIETYQEIIKQSPESEKARAYFELGRAYEKNDEIQSALKAYEEASRLAPNEPATFLRLGVVSGLLGDRERAFDAFNKAEALYKTISVFEGNEGVEVRFQRGVLLNSLTRLADAREQLEGVLNEARTKGNEQLEIRALLELATIATLKGYTVIAEDYATRAIELAQSNELKSLTAQSLVSLADALFWRGTYYEAEKYYKQAVEFAERNKGRFSEARAKLGLGSCQIEQHHLNEGLPYVDEALQFFQRGGYRADASKALGEQGNALELRGDYALAIQAYRDEIELAGQIGAKSLVARAQMGIGFVLADQERYLDAEQVFAESQETYQSLGRELAVGADLVCRGDMLWRMGRYREAKAALDAANAIAARPAEHNKYLLTRLTLVYAFLDLSRRRLVEAKQEAKRALVLYSGYDEAVLAKSALGLVQLQSGAKRRGLNTCLQAVDMAKGATYSRMLPIARLAASEAMLESNDAENALATALEAQQSFEKNGQGDSEWRAWLIAALACQLAGKNQTALEYANRARSVLSSFEQTLGLEAFNSYLARRDVEPYQKRLRELLAQVNLTQTTF